MGRTNASVRLTVKRPRAVAVHGNFSTRRSEPVALLSEHFVPSECPVQFGLYNPGARTVLLAGTFNRWNPKATPMSQDDNGRWSTTLVLEPGTYEYRLIVDGVWQEDPMSASFVANPFGGLNSVVVVKP